MARKKLQEVTIQRVSSTVIAAVWETLRNIRAGRQLDPHSLADPVLVAYKCPGVREMSAVSRGDTHRMLARATVVARGKAMRRVRQLLGK